MNDVSLAPGQWRLVEVQLANWGTFDGTITRVPIARQGHLITGPSGSGKSSLLDAIAVVMTPDKWLRLNQAAQGARVKADQRSIPSYVRGAWSRTVDDDEDRVVSALLRRGATWSAIVLRFDNGEGETVSACRVFFMKATASSAAEVNDLCLLERSAVDVRELEPFVLAGIETRKIQAQWPNAVVTSNGKHSTFYSRLRTLFGIANESALQLLHKTQSAKNLDSLDHLFRESMLERPSTFDLANTAVEQFGELRDAHDRVVQLRLQRDHLLTLRAAAERYDEAVVDVDATQRRSEALIPFQKRRMFALARAERDERAEDMTRLAADVQQADSAQQRAHENLTDATLRVRGLGGDEVGRVQRDLRSARDHAQQVAGRHETFLRQIARLGIDGSVSTPQEFAELMAQVDRTPGDATAPSGPSHDEHARLSHARERLRAIDAEIESVRLSGSTVPSSLLQIRAAIARELNLPVSAIPFAAELLQVRHEFSDWTGAIERVLRPLALTMLVSSHHLPAVRQFVEARRINARLVFEEVTDSPPPPRPAKDPRSLIARVRVSEGTFKPWLAGQISDRFDVVCVDRPDEFDDHVRAVTINGQVKTSRYRYEKDDRVAIDDRSQWVLGDREGKLEALARQRVAAQAAVEETAAIVSSSSEAREAAIRLRTGLDLIRDQRWSDIDVIGAATAIEHFETQLAELTRDDARLRDAQGQVDAAHVAAELALAHRDEVRARLASATEQFADAERVCVEIGAQIESGEVAEVSAEIEAELDRRFRRIQRALTRATVPSVAQQVQTQLARDRDVAIQLAGTAGEEISRLSTQFSERWEHAAVDLMPGIADRQGYLDVLDNIQAHGLPEYEARFLHLLRDRSIDLVGELVSEIQGAPREIAERVEPVNASLRRSRFDDGRYLRLRAKTRRTDTVTRFIAELKSVSEGSWGEVDRDSAERRFAILAELMRKLGSSDHIDRTWRTQCLDTRLHVTFLAEEIDDHDRVHATYDSGAAMSGGQQQKLVVFCLAAALRYQLADADDEVARFGMIVLDEAFDKADSHYTRMALDVFVEFGFQMVLATPQKLLQTIEPYVGGATNVANPSRKRSQVSQVHWEHVP